MFFSTDKEHGISPNDHLLEEIKYWTTTKENGLE